MRRFWLSQSVPSCRPLAGWLGFGNGAGGEYWIQLTGCVPVNPGPGQPGVWQEAGDAPDIVPGQPTAGTGSLLRIFGQMNDSTDVDLYRIRISDPNNFSATTVGGDLDDTQLRLFSLSGNGVAFDDDRPDAAPGLRNHPPVARARNHRRSETPSAAGRPDYDPTRTASQFFALRFCRPW